MSSCTCTNLEGFVYDCLFGHYTILHIMLITRLLEKNDPDIREYVQEKIWDFDEETQSWRGYRNTLDFIFDDCNDSIKSVLNITKPLLLGALLLYTEDDAPKVNSIIESQENSEALIRFILPMSSYPTIENYEYTDFMPKLKNWWEHNLAHLTPEHKISYNQE